MGISGYCAGREKVNNVTSIEHELRELILGAGTSPFVLTDFVQIVSVIGFSFQECMHNCKGIFIISSYTVSKQVLREMS